MAAVACMTNRTGKKTWMISLHPQRPVFPYILIRWKTWTPILSQVVECTGAADLAKVIVNMAEREFNITQELIVKEKFISLFLPVTPKFTSGKSIDNIRARINDAWGKRPKRRN